MERINAQKNNTINNFERKFIEKETKYICLPSVNIEQYFDDNYYEQQTIEQVYLSHPDELYSLRLRETTTASGTTYSATLKDAYVPGREQQVRREFETEITEEIYNYYTQKEDLPTVRKIRSVIAPHITIDRCDKLETPLIEIEEQHNPHSSQQTKAFLAQHSGSIIESSDIQLSMENLAYKGIKHDALPEKINAKQIAKELEAMSAASAGPIIITLPGRSGSGKTTIANAINSELNEPALILSTDMYCRNIEIIKAMQQTKDLNFDLPEVYDIEQLAQDIQLLKKGNTINARNYDFTTGKNTIVGIYEPHSIIIVEGIYAGADILPCDRRIAIPTPFATCTAQRILRDMKERPALADPVLNLRMVLEKAEPAYRAQFNDS